jgi:hypothetical protein
MRNAYRILVVKSERNRLRGWEHNIKMDLGEIGCYVEDWIDLAQVKNK